jgi:hypothetical protein
VTSPPSSPNRSGGNPLVGTSFADAKSHEEQLRSLTPALKQMAKAPQPKHRDLRIVGNASFDRNLPLPPDHPAATEWNIHRYYVSTAGPGPMWNSVRGRGVVATYHTLAAAITVDSKVGEFTEFAVRMPCVYRAVIAEAAS